MIVEELELIPTTPPERRRAPRPEPPPPTSLSPKVRRFVDWHVDRIESSWTGWLVFLGISALCVAFVFWNLTARFQPFEVTYALISERAVLEREFDHLTEHYSRDELRKLLDRISSAESSIFKDYASLASWLAAQAAAAAHEELLLTYVMHEPVAAQIKDVGAVPISLNVRPGNEHNGAVYPRMLNFMREMVGSRWHLEIIDASIAGDGESVTSLDTTIHVWVDAARLDGRRGS